MARPKKEKPNRTDGRYEVKMVMGYNFKGEPIRKSFYSYESKADAKRQADEYKVEMEVAARTGETFIAKDITFGEWAIKWLETYKKGNVKEHTYNYTYRINVEKYLIPYFGCADIKNIRQADIQRYFNKNTNLAKSTLSKHKMILNDIFEKAIYNDCCLKNPVRDIIVSGIPQKKRNVWDKKQSELAYEYSKEQNDGVAVVIFLATGIRRSELIGLKWEDIDFENKTVHIQRAIVPTTGKIVVGGTKSEQSNRVIPLSEDFINYMKHLKPSSKYILSDDGKTFANPNNFSFRFKTYMKNMCSSLDIPILTPHELRHTYGTVLREKGVDIYTIQKLMGHSDISITASIYVHNDVEVLRKNLGY